MTASKISIAELVQRGVDRCDAERRCIQLAPREPLLRYAEQLDRIAVLYDREARWWRVLSRAVYVGQAAPPAFGMAAIRAQSCAMDYAEKYIEHAKHAREHAAKVEARARGAA
jgi:hypothetical protein